MSRWRDRARRLIAKLTADLPPEATLDQRRKALWGKGWEAHQGTNWGRRMWGQEVRAHLARHGDSHGRRAAANWKWPDDVYFPFSCESQTGDAADA